VKCPKCNLDNPETQRFCGDCGTKILQKKKEPDPFTVTLQTSRQDFNTGLTFAGRYQIIEELGRGGMGHVFKVLDTKIGEKIALKVIKPEIASDEKVLERFRNELKLTRKIRHRNVCQMFDFGEEKGIHFITMEYVQGENLKGLIKQVGQLSPGQALSIAEQVCHGLSEAHRHDVIHRDMKPQNIMIDKDGNARIMDFGIARLLQAGDMTDSGLIIGTPEYMSPEQVEGKNVGRQSDIYSLGVILFEMVTGRLPFKGDTPLSIALKQKAEPPPHPRKFNSLIPDSLGRAILKCLEKNPARRYQNAEELLADLKRTEKEAPATKFIPFKKGGLQKIKATTVFHLKKKSWAAIPLALVLIGAGFVLWKKLAPPATYGNFVLLDFFSRGQEKTSDDLLPYFFIRSLAASTKLSVFVADDYVVYKKETASLESPVLEPVLLISCEALHKVTGFDILVSVKHRGRTRSRKFECKGHLDLIQDKLERIQSFLSDESGGLVGRIAGDRTFSQICTGNLDALSHFIKGEGGWKKLNPDAALADYRIALELDPEFSLARLRLAEVQLFRSDRRGAEDNLRRALENSAKLIDYDLLWLRALLARLKFRPNEERQYIKQLVEAFPLSKEYLYQLGESYFLCGDPEGAIKHYAKALDLDPAYALAHNHIAYCYAWMGDHGRAVEHFTKYVAIDHTANSFDSLATGYMFAGRYGEAIETLDKGIEVDPNVDYLYENKARNFICQGRLGLALENIKKAVSVTTRDTTKTNSRFYFAWVEYLRGNLENSLRELRPVLETYAKELYADRLDESPNQCFWLAGLLACRRNDRAALKEAILQLERRIIRNQVNATKFYPVYKFYVHLKTLEAGMNGDLNGVLRNIDEGQRIKYQMGYWRSMFNLPFFFNEYAEILIRMGRGADAVPLLEKSIGYNPTCLAAHYNLAKVYMERKDLEKARQEYQKVIPLLNSVDEDCALLKEGRQLGRTLSMI
jgi:serine/threonine protein kinase/Tfp pilus assembly protein PilF